MKTVKNSISMKALLVAVFAVSFTAFVNGQFQVPNPNSPVTQSPAEDIRTGSTVDYSLFTSHIAGETYRWEVSGGQIVEVNGAPIAAAAAVEFADGLNAHTITVDWTAVPAGDISSSAASIQVQKISADNCPSQVRTLDVSIWNAPSASFTDVTTAICSGNGAAASVTVDFTGAPDDGALNGFTVNYTMTIPAGITVLDGVGDPFVATSSASTNGASVTIDLPATFINTTGGSLDFVLELTTMTDDFDDSDGTVASGTYTVTVHPVPVTGVIESSVSLGRRP
jgi:hypothetical protein